MSKVISAVANDAAEETKLVSIKHTRVMKNANGNDVTVMDYEEIKDVDQAITDAEAHKADLEARLAECEQELVDYQAIKDAE